jgi:hypothetical protein
VDTTTVKTKVKRPSKGMRKHNRRIKQEARKENVSEAELKKRLRTV